MVNREESELHFEKSMGALGCPYMSCDSMPGVFGWN